MRRDRVPTIVRRICGPIVLLLFATACNDTHGCAFSGNGEWSQAQLRIEIGSPDRCPVRKSYHGEPEQFSVNVFGPGRPYTYGGPLAMFEVYSGSGARLVRDTPQIYEDGVGRTTVGTTINYPVGTAPGDDFGQVSHPVLIGSGLAQGSVTLNYDIPPLSQSMSASGPPLIGQQG